MTDVEKSKKRGRKKGVEVETSRGLSDDELLALQNLSSGEDDEPTDITEISAKLSDGALSDGALSDAMSTDTDAIEAVTDPSEVLAGPGGDALTTDTLDEVIDLRDTATDGEEALASTTETDAIGESIEALAKDASGESLSSTQDDGDEEESAPEEGAPEEAAQPLDGEIEEDAKTFDDGEITEEEAQALAEEISAEEAEAALAAAGDEGEARDEHVSRDHLKGLLEALIFASDKPLSVIQIARAAGSVSKEVKPLLEELKGEYSARGIQLDEVANGWIFRTKAVFAPFVRDMTADKPVRLSRAQLETLAILAYRQPVTRPEIDDIRGVDCGAVLKLLLERDLIRMMGKKEEAGRPILYGTTTVFLEFFGLKSLKDLPTLKEFTELNDDSKRIAERELGEALDERQGPTPEVAHDQPTTPTAASLLAQQEADEERRALEDPLDESLLEDGVEGGETSEESSEEKSAAKEDSEESDGDDAKGEEPALNADDEAEYPDDDDDDFDDDDDDDDDEEEDEDDAEEGAETE